MVITQTTACVSCRQRHVKCDFASPACTRCRKDAQACVYVVSRRGQRPAKLNGAVDSPRRTRPRQAHSPNEVEYAPFTVPSPDSLSRHSSNSLPGSRPSHHSTSVNGSDGQYTSPTSVASAQSPSAQGGTADSPTFTSPHTINHNINLYYRNFHPSHPILLPQAFVHFRQWPDYLRDTISLIGSTYRDARAEYECGRHIDAQLDACREKSLETVQAYLLRAIFMHASARARCARESLDKAIAIAREIGLASEWYARAQTTPLLAESARRTWWELYTIDGLFAGFHHKASFATNTPPGDILLPCDDGMYNSGIPPTPSLSFPHLRRRFITDDPSISSHALRIEAISILARVLAANDSATPVCHESLLGLDALLSTWTSGLPATKTVPLLSEPLLFQAHMTLHMAGIYLHLPRSGIFSFTSATDVACARANELLPPFLSADNHAARALSAASALSALASLAPLPGAAPPTPFFVCALVLLAIVQMSHMALAGPEWHLDRLGQVFGLLRRTGGTWRLAANVHAQLRTIALAGEELRQAEFEGLMAEMWSSDTMCYNWERMEVLQPPPGAGGV